MASGEACFQAEKYISGREEDQKKYFQIHRNSLTNQIPNDTGCLHCFVSVHAEYCRHIEGTSFLASSVRSQTFPLLSAHRTNSNEL